MSRIIRSEHGGVWFHVMNHAIGSKDLFCSDIDRAAFLEFLDAQTGSEFGTVAYCLMGNHFHLVVRAETNDRLSAAMQTICSRYARAHNRRTRSDGPVFRSRFVSKPIHDDAQLLVATRYVHRNPLELRLDPRTYAWSSYTCFLGAAGAMRVETDLVLALVGGAAAYRSFVESEHPADRFHMRDGVRAAPSFLGPSPLDRLVEVARCTLAAAEPRSVRDALLVVALDAGLATSDEVAHALAIRSGAAVRALASKARVRLVDDGQLAACVAQLRASIRSAA